MEQTEQKSVDAMEDEALIKTTTRKQVTKQVEEEAKAKKRANREPGPKDLIIVPAEKGLVRIQFEGGGQLPEELKGNYTKGLFAQRDIDRYLSKRGK